MPSAPYVSPAFAPVQQAFERLVGSGGGGGALQVRMRGETVLDLWTGHSDRAGRRPWTRDTLALSFSTTKGVAATVVHRLADRGLIDYDEPIASYWPEFAAGGKGAITVRHLLTHRAGLEDVRAVARNANEILDHERMEERLAARSVQAPTIRSAYHAITYGWLVAGLTRRITGKDMTTLFRSEIAEPLGLSGLHIGLAPGHGQTVAEPVGSALRHAEFVTQVLRPVWGRVRLTREMIGALLVPGFHRLFDGPDAPIWAAQMPAVNGAFTAEALARMYGALANDGADDGMRLLTPERTRMLRSVQVRGTDSVLNLPMRWRLGYHHAFAAGKQPARGFGHYGYGGSGGWADPTTGVSLGFVTNRIGSVSTPLGDLNLMRLSAVVRRCVAGATGVP